MSNPGIAPPDYTTTLGQLRAIIGDVTYVDLVPPVSGQGDYTNYSDQQLQSFLDMGNDNLAYGAGYAYMQLAAVAAAQAVNVKTADEQIDLTKRADALRELSAEWFTRGDSMLEQQAAAYHQIIQPEYARDDEWPPELATPIINIEWWR